MIYVGFTLVTISLVTIGAAPSTTGPARLLIVGIVCAWIVRQAE